MVHSANGKIRSLEVRIPGTRQEREQGDGMREAGKKKRGRGEMDGLSTCLLATSVGNESRLLGTSSSWLEHKLIQQRRSTCLLSSTFCTLIHCLSNSHGILTYVPVYFVDGRILCSKIVDTDQ